jgi:hypothetical protein
VGVSGGQFQELAGEMAGGLKNYYSGQATKGLARKQNRKFSKQNVTRGLKVTPIDPHRPPACYFRRNRRGASAWCW